MIIEIFENAIQKHSKILLQHRNQVTLGHWLMLIFKRKIISHYQIREQKLIKCLSDKMFLSHLMEAFMYLHSHYQTRLGAVTKK